MVDRLQFLLGRLGERLWVKPLIMVVLSVAAAFLASAADHTELGKIVPEISVDSIETLLKVISASMLVIATFSVASMVSAFASAGSTATPRTFPLVIADDVSQNALSTFIGAFIFGIVALIALKNGLYDKAGLFVLFSLTLVVFAIVIVIFVKWVDNIARLGRLGTTIDKVEKAAKHALQRRQCAPNLGGVPVGQTREKGQAIYSESIGYVHRIDVPALQTCAEKADARITVSALPGTFAAPGRALAYVTPSPSRLSEDDTKKIAKAFLIGQDRTFDEDPRFGLIVLSEIASRALSPAVNDPGTAIDIIGTLVRLFALWGKPCEEGDISPPKYDRVEVPEISLNDMFDDAFSAIARDGAGTVEVSMRLLKALESLTFAGDVTMRAVAKHHANLALGRAEAALTFPQDVQNVRILASFAQVG
ncbi:DUF2254 domain-containing protein [Candidatus Nitrospira neomarina]|uniref:DUF2254 domain-containing protein n=1 Tax=Candidatus Nitrospira neomarina TaxID=3020899 RepID=A0AA96JX06_9BACT|nr:DUF2254 domain-containing protein [Candidatus Nitrospira neomarina]WNM63357.1 DUF2254 domain-containing protein [Candidatus Nitrospira neomarina]